MDEAAVRDLLRGVEDPDLGDDSAEGTTDPNREQGRPSDIVSLGLVNEIDVDGDHVSVDLALGAPYSPNESAIAAEVRRVLSAEGLDVDLSASVDRGLAPDEQVLPDVKNVIAVASGKGGVGKSTVAVNLAVGLAEMGARVGLFDADVYGPNVPRMVEADERPQATADETIVPPEKYGIKLISMAFLVGEDDPVIWRGPMIHKLITQLVEDVEWGALDYMIVDLPPGTGDTQLTLLQSVPVSGAVIVTTPQEVAIDDARKGLRMFGKHDTPVLGIVENMSTFRCPDCDGEHAIFGEGGGEAFADENDLPFIGSIPLDPAVREGGDTGAPIVLDEESATGQAFRDFAGKTANMQGIVHRQRESQRGKHAQR